MPTSKLKIEGFGSIKNLEIPLHDKGMHLIQGENGNGKSTLLGAWFFCVYGKSLVKKPKSRIPTLKEYRDEDFKGTYVSWETMINDVPVSIHRTIGYKGTVLGYENVGDSLFLVVDGNLVNDQSQDLNKVIVDLMGMSATVCLNTCFFGQNLTRLVNAKDAERKQVFDEVFDNTFLDLCLQETKDQISDVDDEIIKLERDLTKLNTKCEDLGERIEERIELENTFEDRKEAEMARITAEIKAKKDELDSLKKQHTKLKSELTDEVVPGPLREAKVKLEASINKLHKSIADFDTSYSNLQLTLSDLQQSKLSLESTVIEETCGTCGGKLNAAGVKKAKDNLRKYLKAIDSDIKKATKALNESTILDEVKEQETKLSELNEQLDKINSDLSKMDVINERRKGELRNLKTIFNSINSVQSTITNLIDNLLNAEKHTLDGVTSKELKALRKDLKSQLKKVNADIDLKQNKSDDLNFWKSQFSNSGMKSYVLQHHLRSLNKELTKYSNILGMYVEFHIDFEKARKSIDIICKKRDGVEMNYEEFSGGEQRRVMLITAFAMHAITKSTHQAPFLIVDELFENLDEGGTTQAWSILQDISKETGVYIITHEMAFDMMNVIKIKVEKNGHFTTIGGVTQN